MPFQGKPTPTWRSDPRSGMVALAGNKIITPGTYQWPRGVRSVNDYKIYQSKGPGGRLFRSYDPQILGKEDIGKLHDYWSWSPKSDYPKWKAAQQAAIAGTQKAGAGAPGGLPGRAGDVGPVTKAKYGAAGAAALGGSPVASALGGAATSGPASIPSNPFMTDPGYLSALAAEQTGSQQADNTLRAIQEQAFTQFGSPELAQAAGININPLTAQAAQANTAAGTSTIAGYQRTRDVNQQNILDTLAAQGALDSGQTGYATTRNQEAYGRDVYGGIQTALSGLNTAAATDVSTKQGLHSDVTDALLKAYQTYVDKPQYWGAANTGGQNAAANALATGASSGVPPPTTAPVSTALRAPRAPRLARANAYAAGTARGGRPG